MARVVGFSSSRRQVNQLIELTHAAWIRKLSSQRACNQQKHGDLFPQRLSLPESHGYVPTLSPPQVSSLLSFNETRKPIQTSKHNVVKAFESNQLPSNHPIEDRRAVAGLVHNTGMLFGVYDGHGGASCAQSVGERLLDYIAISLLSMDDLEKYNHAMKTDSPMNLLNKYKFMNDYVSTEMLDLFRFRLQRYVIENLSFLDDMEDERTGISKVIRAIRSAFVRLDSDLCVEAQPASGVVNLDSVKVGLSGACACVVHVDGPDLYAANLGDCRAVLGQLDDDKKWVATALTSDHNVDNEDEVQRVRSAHPPSETSFVLKSNRLLGSLVPLRAFGDIRFKWTAKDLQSLANSLDMSQSQNILLKNYYTPPYLITEPEVRYHKLTENDVFMVIASDGLWEMLSNEEVISLVGEHLEGRLTADRFNLQGQTRQTLGSINQELVRRKSGLAHKSIDGNSATHLIRHALGHEHRKVSEMLTFSPEMSRYYRDDITIIVAYFDSACLSS